ncbi:hypothetical protein ELUMI_v1c07570 [Williamsoniiplasma luminosum]|uniref:J domain-containing protein n=1 Tax=Williamsoniiplasma luminosum TaxID=214888 RepID=A0A2K8NUJ8_9MOLU|nr:DnaJ domain-containing protein [Williamsoniiplasma luminosum]ATZ17479.1 hypothetical protein ELUMI_v1c07570 [Williamsoniiplasma luminosum]
MNNIFIFLIIFAIISVFSSSGGFWYKKSRGKRGAKGDRTFDVFEKNKMIWFQRVQKTHQIPFYGIEEVFNVFPFFSDYNEIKSWLIKKNISSKKIDLILLTLKHYEENFMKYWIEQERNLLIAFDKINLPQSQRAIDFLLLYYNLFLDVFQEQMVNCYIQKIIPAIIGNVLEEDPQKIIHGQQNNDYKHFLHQKIEEFYMNLNNDVQIIIQQLYADINRIRYTNSSFNQSEQNQQSYNFNEQASELGKAYKTLGVDEQISDQELKTKYRQLAMEYHPDKNDSHQAKEKMAKINAAYDLVKKVRNIK